MTDSPSDAPENNAAEDAAIEDETPTAAALVAERVAGLVGSTSWSADHSTAVVHVDRESWVEANTRVAQDGGLPFFSWLSAVDWSKEVAVGEQVDDVDALEERYDVMSRLSSVSNADAVHLVVSVPKDDAVLDSLVPVFGGAAWHERETAEMFGIRFDGHPHLVPLYLPDAFEGHPLRKSYALLAREVKPWPGTVDVEDMPSTENVEAAAQGGDA